jgi:hypothetical protein
MIKTRENWEFSNESSGKRKLTFGQITNEIEKQVIFQYDET